MIRELGVKIDDYMMERQYPGVSEIADEHVIDSVGGVGSRGQFG